MFGLYPSLRNPVYRRFWFGIVPYHIAFQVGVVSTGYAAITVSGSALEIGLIVGAWGIPVLFLPPFGGVAADRFSRRRIMLLCQCVLLAVTLVVATLGALDRLATWHLVVLGLVQGTIYSFYAPARTAYTVVAVQPPLVANAMSAYALSDFFSAVAGPLLGGLLLTLSGEPAVGYAAMCVLYGLVLIIYRGLVDQPRTTTIQGVRAPLAEAVRYLTSTAAVWRVFILAALATLLAMPFQQLMPIFASRVFEVDAGGLGLLLTSVGIGAVAGSLLAARIRHDRLRARQIPLAVALGLSVVAFALTPWFPLALVTAAVAGMAGSSLAVVNYALMLTNTTSNLYGRMASLFQLTFAFAPLSAIPMAVIADRIGARTAVVIAGALLIAAAIALGSRSRAERDDPVRADHPGPVTDAPQEVPQP